jgi:hypothetical protein
MWDNSTAYLHLFYVVLKERTSNVMNTSYNFSIDIAPWDKGDPILERGPFSFNISNISDNGMVSLFF